MKSHVHYAVAALIALLMVLAAAQEAEAQTGTLFVEGDRVGIGIAVPEKDLHVQGEGAQILVRETSSTTADRFLFVVENQHGGASFRMNNLEVSPIWEFFGSNAFFINNISNPGIEFQVNPDGTIVINGSVAHTPDYVFAPDYDLMPLSELEEYIKAHAHLPGVPSAEDVENNGINLQGFQMSILEKVEELTLYILDQEKRIHAQGEQLERLTAQNEDLRSQLAHME